jgi:hypothetical protein
MKKPESEEKPRNPEEKEAAAGEEEESHGRVLTPRAMPPNGLAIRPTEEIQQSKRLFSCWLKEDRKSADTNPLVAIPMGR